MYPAHASEHRTQPPCHLQRPYVPTTRQWLPSVMSPGYAAGLAAHARAWSCGLSGEGKWPRARAARRRGPARESSRGCGRMAPRGGGIEVDERPSDRPGSRRPQRLENWHAAGAASDQAGFARVVAVPVAAR